jgi:hypothetical protein
VDSAPDSAPALLAEKVENMPKNVVHAIQFYLYVVWDEKITMIMGND